MATDLRDTALNPNMPMRRDQLAQMTATPRSPRLGFLADAMMALKEFANRVQVPAGVPLLGGEGVGSLLLGKAPEELVEMSYGNMPMRINPYAGQTASFVPEMKPGRGAQVADLLSLAPTPGGARAAAGLAGMADFGTGAERAIFIGPLARTWDDASNAKAIKMELEGATPQQIWQETGNFRSADGYWRQEISDDVAKLTSDQGVAQYRLNPETATFSVGPMQNVLEHPNLAAAYPDDVLNIETRLQRAPGATYSRGYDERIDLPVENTRSAALHELQHAVQEREGFSGGGTPSTTRVDHPFPPELMPDINEYRALWKSLKGQERPKAAYGLSRRETDLEDYWDSVYELKDPEIKKKFTDILERLESKRETLFGIDEGIFAKERSYEMYRNLAGEAEARAVQARMHMTPEERRVAYPYTSYDVPVERLTVRRD